MYREKGVNYSRCLFSYIIGLIMYKKEDRLGISWSLDETQYRVDCNFECMQSQRSIGI